MSHLIKIYAVCKFSIFVSGTYRVKEGRIRLLLSENNETSVLTP